MKSVVSFLIAVARMFPQRPWATLVPTILSHEALDKLLTPTAGMSSVSGGIHCSPLERFLGCTFLKRHMLRIVTSDEAVRNVAIFRCFCVGLCFIYVAKLTGYQTDCVSYSGLPSYLVDWLINKLVSYLID